jgi:uncharacterized membrane protein
MVYCLPEDIAGNWRALSLSPKPMSSALISKISYLDSHHRLFIALGAAALAFFLAPNPAFSSVHLAIVWITFALTVLLLAWITIFMAAPRDVLRLSALEDSSRWLLLVLVIIAALASLWVVIGILDTTSKQDPNHQRDILLSILSLASSWTLVHTVFTLRYAHLYYGDHPKQSERPTGLDFPGESEPDYLDFAYFSFVIGMTSQVSDVAIRSKVMRRAALAHGVVSFVFNAFIISLTIGSLSGLI